MKAAWAVGVAALVSVPILAVPSESAADANSVVDRQAVSDFGARGDHMITSCPQGRVGASVTVDRFEFGKGLSLRPKPATPCRIDNRAG